VQDKMADALEAQRIATAQAIFNDADDDVEIDEEDEVEESEEIISELDDDEVETA
jgi:hypothetical protein